MTEDEIMTKIAELRETEDEVIKKAVKKAIDSGALNLSAYRNNFLLPKIILNAVYSELGNLMNMNVDRYQFEVDNLKKFL